MADKYLNETGIATIRDWVKLKFAQKTEVPAKTSDLTNDGDGTSPFATQDYVDGHTPESDVFKIVYQTTTSQQIGAAFDAGKIFIFDMGDGEVSWTPAVVSINSSKTVADITTYNDEGVIGKYRANGSTWTEDYTTLAEWDDIPAKTSDLSNDGDGNSPFATEAYVGQNGGKIDSISVNGTAQTIDANKNVDITVPTEVSDLTNDSGFQTASDVQSAIASSVASAVKIKGSVATYADLPATGNQNGDMYDTLDTGRNYVWIEESGSGRWDDYAGTMDLSAYWTSTTGQTNTLEAMTIAEINAILNA